MQAIELKFRNNSMSAISILPSKDNDINKYIETLSISNEEIKKLLKD